MPQAWDQGQGDDEDCDGSQAEEGQVDEGFGEAITHAQIYSTGPLFWRRKPGLLEGGTIRDSN